MSLGYRTYLSSDQITQLSVPVSANQWEYDYDAEAYTQTVVLPEEYVTRAIAMVDIDMSSATSETVSQLLDAWFLVNRATKTENIITLFCFTNPPTIDINIILEVF